MNRKPTVAFAVFASLLLITALPAGASHANFAVGSQHTDFGTGSEPSPEVLDNATVSGTGDDANVFYNAHKQSAVVHYPFEEGSGSTAYDAVYNNDGTIHGATWTSGLDTSQALDFDGQDDYVEGPDQQSQYLDGTDEFTVFATIRPEQTGTKQVLVSSLWKDSKVYTGLNFRLDADGSLRAWYYDENQTAHVVDGKTVLNEGTTYDVAVVKNETHLNLYLDGVLVNASAADPVLNNSGGVNVGGRTWNDPERFFNGTIDAPRVEASAFNQSKIDTLTSDSEHVFARDGEYIAANHSVSNPDKAWTNLSLTDATATVEWQAWDGSQWQVVTSSQYSNTGNHTLNVSGTGYEKWRVNVSFDKTGSNPNAKLHDEGLLVETSEPVVDDSSLSPNSTNTSQDFPITLSADVSDADFGTSHGDTATVYWYVDGEQRGTTTLSANGTTSFELSNVEAGEHNWHIEVKDEYGHRTVSATGEFAAPGELEIYNESDPTSLVEGPNTTVTLRFYFDDEENMIVEREATNGTINMSGLPVDESFVVVADAKGYLPRRIYVQSLLKTQKVYLLPETATAVDQVFELKDYSGDYPSKTTVLQLQRSLNGSWQTVTGDFFGANDQYPAQLEKNVRHRLVLIDTTTGETQILGSYTPLSSGTQTIKVRSSGNITLVSPPVIDVEPGVSSLPALADTTLTTRLNPRGGTLDYWRTNITYHENGSVTTLATANESAGGEVDLTVDLSDRVNGTLKVTVTYRIDGVTESRTVEYDLSESYQNQYSLFNTIGRVDTLIPAGNRASFKVFVSLIVTVVLTTGVVSQLRASTEMAGLTAVGCIAGFSIIGWMTYEVLFAATVAFGAFTAIRRGL